MPLLKPLTNTDASQEAQAVFAEIEAALGQVPNLFRTAAHCPGLLRANWEKYKAVMVGGNLPRKVKEIIALLVSKDNNCQYCIKAHSAALKSMGVSDAELDVIYHENLERAELSVKDIHLITLARTANRAPKGIPEALFERLREAGTTDSEIVETLGVMEVFAGFNHFLDALNVEIDL